METTSFFGRYHSRRKKCVADEDHFIDGDAQEIAQFVYAIGFVDAGLVTSTESRRRGGSRIQESTCPAALDLLPLLNWGPLSFSISGACCPSAET